MSMMIMLKSLVWTLCHERTKNECLLQCDSFINAMENDNEKQSMIFFNPKSNYCHCCEQIQDNWLTNVILSTMQLGTTLTSHIYFAKLNWLKMWHKIKQKATLGHCLTIVSMFIMHCSANKQVWKLYLCSSLLIHSTVNNNKIQSMILSTT